MADPETKMADPETKMVDPETKMADPETKMVDPETKMADPETKMADPETKMVDPETKMADPETTDSERQTAKKSCFQRFKNAISLVPPDATPPNWPILWLIFMSLFSSAFTLTFLFPFLPEMVVTLGYKEEDKGTYVGFIASSVFAGRAAGSFFWGWLSDKKGRRLVLLVTIFFNGLFTFLFGFVDSLWLAMALRFLAGLANGTVGVAKTVLYDISDNTNQAFSMSVISISWGSGLILGPTLGGYLAVPAKKYPGVFSTQGFFADYPFILPSVSCLVVCGIVFVVIFFKFQEPKVVLNTECEAEITVEEDDTEAVAGETPRPGCEGDSKEISLPLLNRQCEDSLHSRPMSIENLHWEPDLTYYYAGLHTQAGQTQFSPAERTKSESLHSLKLWHQPSLDDTEVPKVRPRSYSFQPKVQLAGDRCIVKPQTNHIFPDGAHQFPDSMQHDKAVEQELNRKLSSPGEYQANGELKQTVPSSNMCVLNVKEEAAGREESGEKRRWALSSCWHSLRHSALIELLRMSDVRHTVGLYTIMSFALIGYEDVFTIFASTSVKYEGLGFSTDEIGIALGAVNIPLMIIQIKLFPFLVGKFGIKRAYLINMCFVFIPVQIVPMVHILAEQENIVWLWVCLVLLTLPFRVAGNSCFAGSALLINNSVTSDRAGKVNGLAMTCTAVARTLAPTIGGSIFAWSLKMRRIVGPPLDVNLTFVFFGFILFVSAVHCVFLPDHLDHQQK